MGNRYAGGWTVSAADDRRKESQFDNEWHAAINAFNWNRPKDEPYRSWMYEAKDARRESKRLVRLFKAEREGTLPGSHKQCSMTPTVPVTDNHLTCCLGVQCRKCPELLALDSAKMEPAQIDEAKAWTCVAHILTKGGDEAREGYVLTTDDQMFWSNVYASLAEGMDNP